MLETEAIELAKGFHARRFSTFTEAAMREDPSWILLGVQQQPADALPWSSREHRVWFCLMAHSANTYGIAGQPGEAG